MKTFCLTVQPILFPTVSSPPGQAHGSREVEYKGEIRREPAGCDLVGRSQPLQIEASGESLISKRRIGKPVAEHHGSAP